MKIAHVSEEEIISREINFHLNIGADERIPRTGTQVYASADNGRTGRIYEITEIIGLTFFHYSESAKWITPFVSVDYKAKIKGES